MGCGFSSHRIVINLNRINSFYYSGESLSGNVQLNIIEEKFECDEIFLTLTGEIGYTTTQTVSTGRGQTSTHTQYHHVPFYFVKILFSQPQSGENQLIYKQGEYSWLFEIPLIEHLPPTLNSSQSYPHVRYYLQAVIDKPWYKPNTRETKYVTIFPRINLLENRQCLQSTTFINQNRRDITLKGTLNKFGYVPGELILITLEIENPRKVLIQRIGLSMFQSYQIGRNTHGFRLFEIILSKILNLKDQQIREEFSIILPSVSLPPSYHFQGGLQAIANVYLDYFLKFSIKVEGIFTNFHINVPILLGTEPNPNLIEQEIFNPLMINYSSNPEPYTFTDDDPPPSYDSVVQNIK